MNQDKMHLVNKIYNNQLEKQYNDMPDVFKNMFSCDEIGNYYTIRDPKEVQESFDKFYHRDKKI